MSYELWLGGVVTNSSQKDKKCNTGLISKLGVTDEKKAETERPAKMNKELEFLLEIKGLIMYSNSVFKIRYGH